MDSLSNLALLAGRIMMAGVFLYDSTLIARYPESSATYMEQFGVPSILLWPTAVFQFLGAIFLILGFWTRLTALAFALFCLSTAWIFHRDPTSADALVQFGKDVALAGGFLFLTAIGAGRWSTDAYRERID